jgi:hypothetical protein
MLINTLYSQSITINSPLNGDTISNNDCSSELRAFIYLTFTLTRTTNPKSISRIEYIYLDNSNIEEESWATDTAVNLTIDRAIYGYPGTHTIRIEQWEKFSGDTVYKITATKNVTFDVRFAIFVQNIFNSGNIIVDQGTLPSGSKALKHIGDPLQCQAIEQTADNYNYIWNSSGTNNSVWSRKSYTGRIIQISGATSINLSYTVINNDNYATITANMRKKYNINVQNSLDGKGSGGYIQINNGIPSTSTSLFVVEMNPIVVAAVDQSISGTQYYFHHWSDGINNYTSAANTFYPTDNTSYTAYLISKDQLSIGGPSTITNGIYYTWTATVSMGMPPYTIMLKLERYL